MPYLAILFLIQQFLLGLILLSFFDKKNLLNYFEKIIVSAICGMTVGFFIILLSSMIFGKLETGILVGSIFELIFMILQAEYLSKFFSAIRQWAMNHNFKEIKPLLICLVLVLPVIYIWSKLAFNVLILENGELKGVLIGWGDIAYHFSMIQKFAKSGVFVIEQPIFSGAPLTYPFLVNFASAVFLKFGFDIFWAFHLPVIILGVLGIFAFYLLALRIFKSGNLAILVLLFVLFGSGLGFLWFIEDAQNAYNNSGQSIIETLYNPPHEYTHMDMRTGGKPQEFDAPQNIVWIVPAISFLSHQRSFVWGFALFTTLILFIWLYRKDELLWRHGLIFGLFPLVHGHTFLAVSISVGGWILWQRKNLKAWIYFGISAFIVALPALTFLNQSMNLSEKAGKSFFRWQFGWMTCEHDLNLSWIDCLPRVGTDTNVFYFWSKNFGIIFWLWLLFIILFIFNLIYRKYNKAKELNLEKNDRSEFLKWIFIPSVLLFILPNLLIFQPWDFDNNKVLFYWWIMASFIAVGVLDYFLKLNYFKNKLKFLVVFMVIILVFFAIFSGIIDIHTKLLNPVKNHFGYWGAADKNLADWVIANTSPDSVFLTDSSPTSPIAIISGRSIYLGFTGWLWSQGVNYFPREANIKKILQNNDVNLACNEKIDYIVINNGLIKAYPSVDFNFFKKLEIAYQDTPNNISIIKLNCKNYCK